RDIAGLVGTVARAVHHAHQRGVLHRDLKPSNILLDESGAPHVTDFGLARRLEGVPTQSLSGTVAGTPAYMAPEQARGEKGVSVAADVYGLGGVLYYLLTGSPPFRADSPAETLLLVLLEEPTPPRVRRPNVPRDLELICLKCLEKHPAHRYPSAEAVAEDLDRWLRGEAVSVRPAGWFERALKWARRKPTLATAYVLGCAVVFLLAFASVAAALWKEAERSRVLAEDARQTTEEARQAMAAARDEVRREREKLAHFEYGRTTQVAYLEW